MIYQTRDKSINKKLQLPNNIANYNNGQKVVVGTINHAPTKYISCYKNFYWLLIFLFILAGCTHNTVKTVIIPFQDSKLIGTKVFFNETGGRPDLLVSWNEGEDFISLGLGHFIWYQNNKKGIFKESFPELLLFMQKRGEIIPSWIETMIDSGYPWKNRQEFLDKKHSQALTQLQNFLRDTMPIQTMFIFDRLKKALPKMLATAKLNLRNNIQSQFLRLVDTPGGIYALVDYVNFKGDGTLERESYNDTRWGLLQVLENMRGDSKDINALREFVAIAKKLLKQRIRNAPAGIDENRWLPIWERRLDSYIDSFDLFQNEKTG